MPKLREGVMVHACADKESWLQQRRKTVGSSDVPVILGLSPFSTPLRLWAEKTGRVEPEDLSKNLRIRLGVALEPLCTELFYEETDKICWDPGPWTLYYRDTFPHLHTTPDRLVLDRPEGAVEGVLEIKTTEYGRPWTEEIPDWVRFQLATSMLVMGVEYGWACALIGRDRFVWKDLKVNSDTRSCILQAAEDFMDRVQRDTPPETVQAEDRKIIAKVLDYDKEMSVELPERFESILSERERLREEIKTMTAKKDQIEAEVLAAMFPAQHGVTASGWRVTRSEYRRPAYEVKESTIVTFRFHKPRES